MLEAGGGLAENKGKGRGKEAWVEGIKEVEKGGRKREKNNKSPPSHEGCLQFTGQEGTGLSGCLRQWFPAFFPPTNKRHTTYFHQ